MNEERTVTRANRDWRSIIGPVDVRQEAVDVIEELLLRRVPQQARDHAADVVERLRAALPAPSGDGLRAALDKKRGYQDSIGRFVLERGGPVVQWDEIEDALEAAPVGLDAERLRAALLDHRHPSDFGDWALKVRRDHIAPFVDGFDCASAIATEYARLSRETEKP